MDPPASLSKNLYRRENEIGRGGVNVATEADFFGGKSHLPEKNRYLADFATRICKIQAKSGGGGSGGGVNSPVHQAGKKFFDSLPGGSLMDPPALYTR